jgi:hypothetical protein
MYRAVIPKPGLIGGIFLEKHFKRSLAVIFADPRKTCING